MTLDQVLARQPPIRIAGRLQAEDVATNEVQRCLLDPERVLLAEKNSRPVVGAASFWSSPSESYRIFHAL